MEYPHRIGERRDLPPLDMDLAVTTFVPAGAVTIGVENRRITDDIIRQNYAYSAAIVDKVNDALVERGQPFDDGGVSLHVCDATSGVEYLRFDAFKKDPHYHYIFPDRSHIAVRIDESAVGDALDWILSVVSDRIPPMLTTAGVPELATGVVADDVASAMPKVRELAEAGR